MEKTEIKGEVIRTFKQEWSNGIGSSNFMVLKCPNSRGTNYFQIRYMRGEFYEGDEVHCMCGLTGKMKGDRVFTNLTLLETL